MTLIIEHPCEYRWDVERDGDLVGMVLGNPDIGFMATDHEGYTIGNYGSSTMALLAVSRDDEIGTLEVIWSQAIFLGQTYDGEEVDVPASVTDMAARKLGYTDYG